MTVATGVVGDESTTGSGPIVFGFESSWARPTPLLL